MNETIGIDQSIAATLASQGFFILRGFLDQAELAQLEQACQPITNEYGVRQVLQIQPNIAQSLPWQKIQSVLNAAGMSAAKPVRSLFFNKNAAHNWLVPWHQDMTICVNHKTELAGYSKWTLKNGVHHVEPPTDVLDQMLTLRIAMDAANHENAALKVLAGSHRHGKLMGRQLGANVDNVAQADMHACTMQEGDVLLMKPLLLHASDKALNAGQRRVLHLEFSASALPAPIQWAEATQTAQVSPTTN
ncbi:phytanoyl-CoA dioxygenase family protein [Undibacterium umbellatum]|uniref:Phytanoyl-CoA dioxygenase family protein n=1 Tax=Undibacterium umbellatum TaxID=2762300 RepID=A0ABR6ZDY4_9BURK|nr:phytanoyl-CoA dioxygenase family protein [Undibacterium umbellatum]MBC3909913.1 phytanoyl-CoA dioxygenase family protein [Undibacterium umbellatum]